MNFFLIYNATLQAYFQSWNMAGNLCYFVDVNLNSDCVKLAVHVGRQSAEESIVEIMNTYPTHDLKIVELAAV